MFSWCAGKQDIWAATSVKYTFEHKRPVKIQISLSIRTVFTGLILDSQGLNKQLIVISNYYWSKLRIMRIGLIDRVLDWFPSNWYMKNQHTKKKKKNDFNLCFIIWLISYEFLTGREMIYTCRKIFKDEYFTFVRLEKWNSLHCAKLVEYSILLQELNYICILLNLVVRFNVFFGSANLIYRGTYILKCFRESLNWTSK